MSNCTSIVHYLMYDTVRLLPPSAPTTTFKSTLFPFFNPLIHIICGFVLIICSLYRKDGDSFESGDDQKLL